MIHGTPSARARRFRRIAAYLAIALLVSTSRALAQVPFETVENFDGRLDLGGTANSIMQAADGYFYLTSARGGPDRRGSIFRMTVAGVVTPLHDFSGGPDGATPFGPLLQAADGYFYGTTERGGAADLGTVFRMSPDGAVTVLHAFEGGASDGAYPRAGLMQAADGYLYGTTYYGGLGYGTIFRMTASGVVTLVYAFTNQPDAAPAQWSAPPLAHPHSSLLQTADGDMYGTMAHGAFRMSAGGIVKSIDAAVSFGKDLKPRGAIVQGEGGSLYFAGGTDAASDGLPASPFVSRYGPLAGAPPPGSGMATVWDFAAGAGIIRSFMQATSGEFYGTTSSGGASGHGTLFRMGRSEPVPLTPFQDPITLYSFETGTPDALIEGQDGNLYGTTSSDGASGIATVFRMDADGTVAVLHAFAASVQDAAGPSAFLQARDEDFYGTTTRGGAFGLGTAFRLTAAGQRTELHAFSGGLGDGAFPDRLIEATNRDLYGTTTSGGASGRGTLFHMTRAGDTSLLYSFDDGVVGTAPTSLIQAADGSLYGTTAEGGAASAGTVFRMTADGTVAVVHAFVADIDGGAPRALIQARDGDFYGMSEAPCGANVFRMSPQGALTILYTPPPFSEFACVTAVPLVLVQGDDGALYGTVSGGEAGEWGSQLIRVPLDGPGTVLLNGTYGVPTGLLLKAVDGNLYGPIQTIDGEAIARVTPVGGVSIMHTFDGGVAVGSCSTPLFEATDGNMYGACRDGGVFQSGTLFRLLPRPAPIDVTVGVAGSGRVRLSWKPVAGAVRYRIWRRTAHGQQEIIADNVTVPTFVDDSVTNGQRYYYVVNAITAFGASVASYEVAATPGPAVPADFDGDGQTDIAIYRPSTGVWHVRQSDTGTGAFYQWGRSEDVPVPGDYDGDRRADVAVFRPSTNIWYVLQSSTGNEVFYQWGLAGDVPAPGDYDGDGKTDIAVFRPSTGIWYVIESSTGLGGFFRWGAAGDEPASGDYDGDGHTDVAVFRPSTGAWYVYQSSTGTGAFYRWGTGGDVPVPGDYDGDGRTDAAVYRPSTRIWYIRPSGTGAGAFLQWGLDGDLPVPGDYDGDGRTDIVVYRPSTGIWYILPSDSPSSASDTQSIQSGASEYFRWGFSDDTPVLKRP